MPDNTPLPAREPEKQNELSRTALLLGLIYLPLHIFLLPLLLGMWGRFSPDTASDLVQTVVYYALGAAFSVAVMWRWLRGEFDSLLNKPLRCLLTLAEGYLADLLLSYAALALTELLTSFAGDPMSAETGGLAAADYSSFIGLAVFLAPVTEELLFRGVLFGALRKKSRAAAYIVSTLVYALYGVWQYAAVYGDAAYLIYAVQFLPPALAFAWSYERSGSIWTAVFLHMLVNGVSAAYMM